MTPTQTFTGQLVILHCYKCHVAFGMERSQYDRAQSSGDDFYCTIGHGQVFSVTEEQRLREKLQRAESLSAARRASLIATQDQLAATERSLRAQKAAKTRLRNQIAKGVCPCCRRNFVNVRDHMASQHPEFTKHEEAI